VVEVEEDDTVVGDLFAIVAGLILPAVFLAAEAAPVIDQPVILAAHILLEPAVVEAVHLAVAVVRLGQQSFDNLDDPGIAGRVAFLDLGQLAAEQLGGLVEIGVLARIAEHRFARLMNYA